jgi:hypothetical protein
MMGRAGFGGAKPAEEAKVPVGKDMGFKKSDAPTAGGWGRAAGGDQKQGERPTFKKQEPAQKDNQKGDDGWSFAGSRRK